MTSIFQIGQYINRPVLNTERAVLIWLFPFSGLLQISRSFTSWRCSTSRNRCSRKRRRRSASPTNGKPATGQLRRPSLKTTWVQLQIYFPPVSRYFVSDLSLTCSAPREIIGPRRTGSSTRVCSLRVSQASRPRISFSMLPSPSNVY